MPIAVNGIFGNLGVGSAALVTGLLIDSGGWRFAFLLPGIISIIIGVGYIWFLRQEHDDDIATKAANNKSQAIPTLDSNLLVKIVIIVLFTTALGGLIFQSTTFALPKILDERLSDLALSATSVGWYAFIVFAVAAFAQLIVGWLVDNYSIRIVFFVVAVTQCLFFIAMISMTGIAALLISIGFMLAVFGQIPINDVLLGRIAKSEWRSRLLALRYVVTFSVQASSLPLIAWIHKSYGFDRPVRTTCHCRRVDWRRSSIVAADSSDHRPRSQRRLRSPTAALAVVVTEFEASHHNTSDFPSLGPAFDRGPKANHKQHIGSLVRKIVAIRTQRCVLVERYELNFAPPYRSKANRSDMLNTLTVIVLKGGNNISYLRHESAVLYPRHVRYWIDRHLSGEVRTVL